MQILRGSKQLVRQIRSAAEECGILYSQMVRCHSDKNKENEEIDERIKIEKENIMHTEELKFYPKHPSNSKTHQIETTAMSVMK